MFDNIVIIKSIPNALVENPSLCIWILNNMFKAGQKKK